jgi:hypothetical protein
VDAFFKEIIGELGWEVHLERTEEERTAFLQGNSQMRLQVTSHGAVG